MRRKKLSDLLYYPFKIILKILYWTLFRYEVRGVENVPHKGGVIIAANHRSYLDPPLIGIALKRKGFFLAKASLFSNPLIGWFVKLYSLPIEKDRPRPSTMKTTLKALKEGLVIVIFPEGRRVGINERAFPQEGVGMIASVSKVPIVPAYIEGTERALPPGAKLIRPVKVRITFGKPILYNYDRGLSRKEIAEDIMKKIEALRG